MGTARKSMFALALVAPAIAVAEALMFLSAVAQWWATWLACAVIAAAVPMMPKTMPKDRVQ